MKKFLVSIIAAMVLIPTIAITPVYAKKKHGHYAGNEHTYNYNYNYTYKYKNYNNYDGWQVGAGILGGLLLGGIIANQNNYPPPGYYVQGVQCQLWDPYNQQYIWAQGEVCVR